MRMMVEPREANKQQRSLSPKSASSLTACAARSSPNQQSMALDTGSIIGSMGSRQQPDVEVSNDLI